MARRRGEPAEGAAVTTVPDRSPVTDEEIERWLERGERPPADWVFGDARWREITAHERWHAAVLAQDGQVDGEA